MACCDNCTPDDRPQSVRVVDDQDELFNFKVVLLGNSGVGKSALANRIVNNKFVGSTPTVGAAFWKVSVELHPGQSCDLEIWDTAGQERYRSLSEMYIRGSKAVIVLYDVSEKTSFDGVKFWLGQVKQFGNKTLPPFFLVANKVDMLHHEVTPEEAHNLCKSHPSSPIFHEVSAMDGTGVEYLVSDIAQKANVFCNGPSARNVKRAV